MTSTVRRAVACALAAACAAAAAAPALVLHPAVVHASGPTLLGAGSTWVQIALDQWRADIARQGYSINYQGNGSSAGREFYIINRVDFAASEIPFQPDEVSQLQSEHKSYQYLPDVAGGTSLMYNLHTPDGTRITTLRLTADAAAKIFTGVITSWQDPEIQALNPGLVISETTLTPVIRSDGSGTSAQFSLYLANQAASVWNAFVARQGCQAPCSQWPPFNGSTQQAGSDGVANFIANDAIGGGAIGYVEAGYAFGRGFPVASLHNASGNYAQPTSSSVATALTHATLNADLTQNLTSVYSAPEPNAYPMSSYSYMITQTTGFDPAKGFVLGTWLIYIACSGQREAQPLGYSPLPPNLVAAVFGAISRIPGAPPTPPIDRVHCPNPTVTNAPGSPPVVIGGPHLSGSGGPAAGPSAAATAAPGASAAPSAAAAAGPTGPGGDSSTPDSGVDTLSADQRLALLATAEQDAGRGLAQPVLPLALAAVLLVLAVFTPLVMERRWPGAWARVRRRGRPSPPPGGGAGA